MSHRLLPQTLPSPPKWFLDHAFCDVWNNSIFHTLEPVECIKSGALCKDFYALVLKKMKEEGLCVALRIECCKCGATLCHGGKCQSTWSHLVKHTDPTPKIQGKMKKKYKRHLFLSPQNHTILPYAIESLKSYPLDDTIGGHYAISLSLEKGVHPICDLYYEEQFNTNIILRDYGYDDQKDILYINNHGRLVSANASIGSWNLYWGRKIDREQLFKMKFHIL